jgi:dTDP-4-amino-4,6-dideoxygalactose transaminase
MKVDFVDLKSQVAEIDCDSVMEKIKAGQFMGADEFEKAFAMYHGAKYCVGVGSGTDALWLTLLALGIGPGDEVIVPANTYIATAFAVSHTGAKPVFCDVSMDNYTMETKYIKKVLTDRTKAIIPVHLYGQPVHVKPLLKFGLPVIEDCAQATGAVVFGKKVGTIGTAGAFSFYPTKNLGGLGQGGAVITDDRDIARSIRELGNVGRTEGSWHSYSWTGFNSRLDAVNAEFLRLSLKKLDEWNARRFEAAMYYEDLLNTIADIVHVPFCDGIVFEPVFHLYEIQLKSKSIRDKLKDYLDKNGVGTGLHYPIPCHKQIMYRRKYDSKCPNAEKLADRLLSLPMHPFLQPEQIEYVCGTIAKYFR